ncbi:hypothetical protein [Corynebacterium crudilactis]|uniref:Uncharacterized protein n=1 Tax=Corynebacterium crudilactis TaxID=1652495 RepID=A0A172QV21_9CORY|nr:hypothetical protein [Corynebacterium crudilactis]ANE04547.1 hypothetical protein ccrud_10265 [Corynebacterium crudilactis]
MNSIFKLFRVLFVVFLVSFLIGGTLIVGVQTVGVIMLNEGIVTSATRNIAPWAFVAATLCAVCAFVLRYSPDRPKDMGSAEID